MDQETNDLIARQYLSEKNLGRVEAGELAEWASLQLEKGHDTPGLRTLASGAGESEAEARFRECLSELGWEVPEKKAALKRHAESIMQRMLDGAIAPYDGCSNLYIISIYLKHPNYLYNWNGLFWAREDVAEEELNEMILDEARRGLSGEAAPANESLPRHEAEDEELPGFWDRIRELLRRK